MKQAGRVLFDGIHQVLAEFVVVIELWPQVHYSKVFEDQTVGVVELVVEPEQGRGQGPSEPDGCVQW